MSDPIRNIFRNRALKKFRSSVPTGITPLDQIHSAVAFIDVEDTSFDDCKEAILAFYREHEIKGEIFFFDFRKITSDELLITSIQTTVLKRDLNWIGRPNKEKINLMLGSDPDLFISLINGQDFPIEFMAACSKARFKIGRTQLKDHTFDLVLTDPKDKVLSQYEVFEELKQILSKIK